MDSLIQHGSQQISLLSKTLIDTDLTEITLNNNSLTLLLLSLGGELLQILSQQDQATTGEEVEEPVVGAAAHLIGEADGAPTDGRDEELQDALAAETQHKVGLDTCLGAPRHTCIVTVCSATGHLYVQCKPDDACMSRQSNPVLPLQQSCLTFMYDCTLV